MLAGGVGYAKQSDALKKSPKPNDKLVMIGGDNYRIGMGGSSVSSSDTGEYASKLELSAVQRANPEMQKRGYNAIRALVESDNNPIVSIHDHGAGGHVNCFSELLEQTGGRVDIDELPVGDPTLSAREIIANESQERMGLIVPEEAIDRVMRVAKRERAPAYVVGEITDSQKIEFIRANGEKPIDLPLDFLFESSPETVLKDQIVQHKEQVTLFDVTSGETLLKALKKVLSLESVACKDWLTNKVDRSVTGRIAQQQCIGPLQLPLANLGATTLDYTGTSGIAMSIGHAPISGLVDAGKSARLSVSEALTNILWAPLKNGLSSVALSANWMWPAGKQGENAKLYEAARALSEFSIALGIPVPTGKDSLSMTMSYDDGKEVKAPGTVVVSAAAEISDIKLTVTPDLKPVEQSVIIYFDLSSSDEFPLGASSFAQTNSSLGSDIPDVQSTKKFINGFAAIQQLILNQQILAGHDVSSGGLLTTLCETAFTGNCGLLIRGEHFEGEKAKLLFSEKPAVILQVNKSNESKVLSQLSKTELGAFVVAEVNPKSNKIELRGSQVDFSAKRSDLLDSWYRPSHLLDLHQTAKNQAEQRYNSLEDRRLDFNFPTGFTGLAADYNVDIARQEKTGIKAAIIREKGTNGDREMAFSMHAAGFDVKDITMVDITSGKETLEDLQFIVFPGGFSNSDVLGAARGWAGAFRYNDNAKVALDKFYNRPNTMSLGVCNGCQLMTQLGIFADTPVQMTDNNSGKFESGFLSVEIPETNSIMLKPLVNSKLGVWIAHGEGRFVLPADEKNYDIPIRYVLESFPANPNGSDYNAAAICSLDGRHLAIMPHIERSYFPWQWAYYGEEEKREISPWALTFVAAKNWLANTGEA